MIGHSRHPRRILDALRREERGAALVEFALVLPLVLLLLLGMLDFGKAYNYWIDETHLVNAAGARWAAVDRNPGPGATLQESSAARRTPTSCATAAPTRCRRRSQVCIGFPERAAHRRRDPVQVTVSANYHFLPFIGDELGMTPDHRERLGDHAARDDARRRTRPGVTPAHERQAAGTQARSARERRQRLVMVAIWLPVLVLIAAWWSTSATGSSTGVTSRSRRTPRRSRRRATSARPCVNAADPRRGRRATRVATYNAQIGGTARPRCTCS